MQVVPPGFRWGPSDDAWLVKEGFLAFFAEHKSNKNTEILHDLKLKMETHCLHGMDACDISYFGLRQATLLVLLGPTHSSTNTKQGAVFSASDQILNR